LAISPLSQESTHNTKYKEIHNGSWNGREDILKSEQGTPNIIYLRDQEKKKREGEISEEFSF